MQNRQQLQNREQVEDIHTLSGTAVDSESLTLWKLEEAEFKVGEDLFFSFQSHKCSSGGAIPASELEKRAAANILCILIADTELEQTLDT